MTKLDELGAKMLQSLAGLREIRTGVGALAQGWKGPALQGRLRRLGKPSILS